MALEAGAHALWGDAERCELVQPEEETALGGPSDTYKEVIQKTELGPS